MMDLKVIDHSILKYTNCCLDRGVHYNLSWPGCTVGKDLLPKETRAVCDAMTAACSKCTDRIAALISSHGTLSKKEKKELRLLFRRLKQLCAASTKEGLSDKLSDSISSARSSLAKSASEESLCVSSQKRPLVVSKGIEKAHLGAAIDPKIGSTKSSSNDPIFSSGKF